MERCPKCHKFRVNYEGNGIYRCLWKACGYTTNNSTDIINAKHPIKHQKFIDTINKKEVSRD